MNKLATVGGVLLLALAVTGCATKQYPQASTVTPEETALFDCHSLQLEIAKTRSVQREIESTGDFDGRTVLGVLGDFGIGNGMAKSDARKKAQARLEQLESLKDAKCQQPLLN